MIVLGMETSGQRGSVAVVGEKGVLGHAAHDVQNAHAEQLVPLIDAAMAQARCTRQNLSRIAVGTGPGSFTGLRVGIAFGCGLGLGLHIPVVGVCSLAAMAQAMPHSPDCAKVVVRDARRGELFCAIYNEHNLRLLGPSLVSRSEFYDWVTRQLALMVCTTWTAGGDGLRHLDKTALSAWRGHIDAGADELVPDARQIAILGANISRPQHPEPEYVRQADATLPQLTLNLAGSGEDTPRRPKQPD